MKNLLFVINIFIATSKYPSDYALGKAANNPSRNFIMNVDEN
jgi:hypothetical protein